MSPAGTCQGAGLLVQDFEVVVEPQPLGSLSNRPFVTGRHPSSFTSLDHFGTEIDNDASPGKAGRD